MKRIILMVGCALLLPTAAMLRAQSLAELAKREKDRRESIQATPKVITNHEVRRYRSGAVTTVALPPSEPAKPAGQKPLSAATAEDEPTDLQGRPESFWRQTMADARKRVQELENEANVLTLKVADLQNRFYREDNGFKQQEIQREIQKAFYEQDINKENLAKAKGQLANLEMEARKSGALPGWLRP